MEADPPNLCATETSMRRALWAWSPRQAMLPSVVTAAPISPAGRMGTSAMSECSPYPPERTADLGGEQALPLSASPHRADPRPPTLRSVGQDLANQIRNAAGGDPVLARSILDETLRDLHELDYVGATSGFSSQKESNTAALLLTSLKDYVTGPLALPPSGGTRTVAQAASLAAIAAALHSTEVEQQRLVKAARELTGLSRSIWTNGKDTRATNDEACAKQVRVGGARSSRADAQDLDFLYDWFHNESPDVEPDKSTKFQYKRKRVFKAGVCACVSTSTKTSLKLSSNHHPLAWQANGAI